MLWCALGGGVLHAGPGAANPFGGRRVLIIGIDGCRGDAIRLAANAGLAPNVAALLRTGTVTWNAFAGGPPAPNPSNQPTYSGPGWSSILTGVWTDQHLVTDNTFLPNNFATYPAFLRRIKEAAPTAFVASAVSWNPIDSGCIGASQNGSEFMDSRFKAPAATFQERDRQVRDQVVSLLGTSNPDVVFVHFDQVDDYGHATGFSKTNPDYLGGIATVDGYIGNILSAMRARTHFSEENWCVILVPDHGGIGTSHGGQSGDERTIWIIVNGDGARAGRVSTESPGHTCIPATALAHLGLTPLAGWGMDPTVFGLGDWCDAALTGSRVLLSWAVRSGTTGATGCEVWRNGSPVATLPLGTTDYADTPPAGGGTHSYEIHFPGSPHAPLTCVVSVPDLTGQLVLSLPFDGSVLDASGHGNHPVEVGGASVFAPGLSGQAVVLNATRYLRLGSTGALLPDLQFGATSDFTISFWVNVSAAWAADPVFISNKNWASGGNQGWVIAGQTNATTWQWNLKGASLSRKDYDPTGNNINDGQWHHLAVTHARTGSAAFFHDGTQIGTVDISGAGSVDTAFPVCLGRDGNLGFPWNVELAMDDLRIWRRALTAAEVGSLADKTKGYANWRADQFTAAQLSDVTLSGALADPDADGLATIQEYAFARPPRWPDAGQILQISREVAGPVISYPQRNGGTGTPGVDYTAGGVLYLLEYTPSLSPANWQPVTTLQIEEVIPPVNNCDGTHTVHLRLKPPLSLSGTLHVRLKVVVP